ncbi:hypothetical protein BCR33DRAFT_461035 [Rhizoclosmatium globosum]|uniref:Uncharacterized protein n=1 Tax=Rhizoclosmatium globosum TaxID=329046 RepID=A0A1Y2CZ66_9FUNG|nr:hypothetical protein BCR33DRAFT_461035 [Rhizoclosmatium globosum]|eukprot:ORY51645.1 hypothetical protein BCR33DRAFT_461035 [Rhizoclosmatium globosum]
MRFVYYRLQKTNAKDESEITWHQIMLAHPKLSVWQPKQLSYRWYLIKAKALPHLQALGKFQDCIVYLLELFRAKRVSIGGDASSSAKSIVSAEFIDESDEDENDEGLNNNEQPAVIAVKPKKVKKNKKKSDMAVATSSQSVIGANNVVPSESEVIVPAKSVNNGNNGNKDAQNSGRNDNDARVQTTIAVKNVKKNKNETSATILAEATPAATTPLANSPKKKKRKAMLDSQYSESSPKLAEITAAVTAEKPQRKNQSSEMENSTTPTDEPPKKKKNLPTILLLLTKRLKKRTK